MERLTFDGLFCDIAMCREIPCPYDGMCSQRKTWERLKEYEDAGLEPDQINRAQETLRCFDNIGIKRGNEIVSAEQNGRLVVLPCKVGDTVWFTENVFNGEKVIQVIAHRMIDGIGGNSLNPIWLTSKEPYELRFHPSEFCKTFFLTREEAEATMADGGN